MARHTYDWKRYWVPRGSSYHLDTNGYLLEPLDLPYRSVNASLATLDNIADIPVLVLLGEPGMGKTHEMHHLKRILQKRYAGSDTDFLFVDLADISSVLELNASIFDNPIVANLLHNDRSVHLMLDSFDECRLRLDTVAIKIADKLSNYPQDRLRLTIACRTLDWPKLLEERLKEQWKEEDIRVYELACLRRQDVVATAERRNIDANQFIEQIESRSVVPFAIKPVSLELLVGIASSGTPLPASTTELYRLGCLHLCKETNQSRTTSRSTGNIEPEQRLLVAGRIAAIMIVCRKNRILDPQLIETAPDGMAVTLEQVLGYTENWRGNPFIVNRQAVLEALGTGLFSGHGTDALGFAHQTYAEFLAAWYIKERGMPLQQVVSFLSESGTGKIHIIPQLREVVAWLASFRTDVFKWLLDCEPLLLLRHDLVANLVGDEKITEQLIDRLIELCGRQEIDYTSLADHAGLRILTHTNLALMLRQTIEDKEGASGARFAAVEIARARNETHVIDALVSIALDPSEDRRLRLYAVRAIADLGDSGKRTLLIPLALHDDNTDIDDEIKGIALRAVWPELISVEELFSSLTVPKQKNFYGTYVSFAESQVSQHLSVAMLPVALTWVETQELEYMSLHRFSHLIQEIVRLAWEHIDDDDTVSALARVCIKRIKGHHPVLPTDAPGNKPTVDVQQSANGRKRLVLALLPLMTDVAYEALQISYILSPDDLDWLVSALDQRHEASERLGLAKIIRWIFQICQIEKFDLVYDATNKYSCLRDEVWEMYFAPVNLFGEKAEEGRQYYSNELKRMQRDEENVNLILFPSITERIIGQLDEFDKGASDAWWRINYHLSLRVKNRHFEEDVQSDVTQMEEWCHVDEATRSRIVNAAFVFLKEEHPQLEEPDTYKRVNRSSYRAILLLLNINPNLAASLPNDTLRRWASTVVRFPQWNEQYETYARVIEFIYKHAPDEVTNELIALLDEQSIGFSPNQLSQLLQTHISEKLAPALLSYIGKEGSALFARLSAIDILLAQNIKYTGSHLIIEDVIRYIRDRIVSKIEHGVDSEELPLLLSRLLMYTKGGGWDILGPALQNEIALLRQVVECVAKTEFINGRAFSNLTPPQLVDLYVWLNQQYPSLDVSAEAHFLSSYDHVSDWRDKCLNHLLTLGTSEAVEAARQIKIRCPHLEFMWKGVLLADEERRKGAWMPPSVDQFTKLVEDGGKRFVTSASHLTDVVMDSLQSLQSKLIGDNPRSIFLWDEADDTSKLKSTKKKTTTSKIIKPKNETALSLFVQNHLQDELQTRGIISNREVQIRPAASSGGQESVDILVDAIVKDSSNKFADRVSLIIEVKGSWHREVKSALNTQLTERYLQDNQCTHGIYLVGWFDQTKWSDSDYRKKDAPKWSPIEARTYFDSQARSVAEPFGLRAFVLEIK